MAFRKFFVLFALVVLFIVTASAVQAASQNYILTFSEGTTVVLMRLSKSDTGAITLGTPVIHPFGRTVGATAVDPILDTAGNLAQVRVYVSYVGTNNLPTVSLLTFNSQLQAPFETSVSETPLPKLKPGQYQPLHIFQLGTAKKLLGAGPFGGAQANDYVAYTLNPAGIAPGGRKVLFNNPTGTIIFGAGALRQGGLVGQLRISRASSATNAPQIDTHSLIVRLISAGILGAPLSDEELFYLWYCLVYGFPPDDDDSPSPASPSVNGPLMASRSFRNLGTAAAQNQVSVQDVDPTTGLPTGTPRPVTNFTKTVSVNTEVFQGLAMAPDASLLAYNVLGPCQRYTVKVQGLKDRKKNKAPKIAFGCDKVLTGETAYGLDLAPLPATATP